MHYCTLVEYVNEDKFFVRPTRLFGDFDYTDAMWFQHDSIAETFLDELWGLLNFEASSLDAFIECFEVRNPNNQLHVIYANIKRDKRSMSVGDVVTTNVYRDDSLTEEPIATMRYLCDSNGWKKI